MGLPHQCLNPPHFFFADLALVQSLRGGLVAGWYQFLDRCSVPGEELLGREEETGEMCPMTLSFCLERESF